MCNTVQMIDPPEGWRYGFPKPAPSFSSFGELTKWMMLNNYPQKLIDQGMLQYCRYITVELKDDNG